LATAFHPQRTVQRIILSLALCLLFSLPLRAQEYLNHVTFDVGAGFSFPVGQTANHTKMGFNFVASGGPRFNRRFSLTADFSLHYLNVKNSFIDPVSGVDLSLGSIMRMWSLTANPTFEFIKQERFNSYATGGYGLYNRRLDLASNGRVPATACERFFDVCVSNPLAATGDLSPYKGGYNVGGGVMFGSHTKFFVEMRYHHMFTTNAPTEIIPLSFGIRW
jgi:opacity protein-like surface antigen